MIDIHCHIIPEIDDGAKDLDTALQMCKIAVSDGIKTIVATPHDLNGVFFNPPDKLLESLNSLKAQVLEAGIDIELLPGADVFLQTGLDDKISSGNVMTINNSKTNVLLELPHYFILNHIKNHIFQLRIKDITPVITHPERNEFLMNNLNFVQEMIYAGALMQLTSGSITGSFGYRVKKFSHLLLRHNMAHVIASDAHDTVNRPPTMSDALMEASKIVGQESAHKMVNETPELLIKGITPEVQDPLPIKKRTFLSMMGLDRLFKAKE